MHIYIWTSGKNMHFSFFTKYRRPRFLSYSWTRFSCLLWCVDDFQFPLPKMLHAMKANESQPQNEREQIVIIMVNKLF